MYKTARCTMISATYMIGRLALPFLNIFLCLWIPYVPLKPNHTWIYIDIAPPPSDLLLCTMYMQILKKHARSQEEKMKKWVQLILQYSVHYLASGHNYYVPPACTWTCRMATKLLRLTSDEKKEAKRDGQWTAGIMSYMVHVHVHE